MKRIELTQGKYALVDDEDYEYVLCYKWHTLKSKKNYYAVTALEMGNGKKFTINMHNFVTENPQGSLLDHINRNGLDNRKANLRKCSYAQNSLNRRLDKLKNKTGYRGVYLSEYKNKRKFTSYLKVNGSVLYLGIFESKIQAAKAYDNAAKLHHKEFAVLNFPEKRLPSHDIEIQDV